MTRNLENGEQHNHRKCGKENIHGTLRFLRDFLVQNRCGATVHVFLHLRILESRLEGGILVEVQPALVRDGGCSHDTANACGNRNRNHLQVVDLKTVRIRDDHERCHRSGNRRTGNAHLRRDGSHATRALRTDSLLEGDIANDRHQRIDHVTRTHEHREEERAERRQNGDVIRVLAQQPFRQLDQPIHTARRLQDTRTRDRRDNDVDNIGRGLSRLHAKTEHENRKADSRNRAERKAPVTRPHVKCKEHNQQLNNHECHGDLLLLCSYIRSSASRNRPSIFLLPFVAEMP